MRDPSNGFEQLLTTVACPPTFACLGGPVHEVASVSSSAAAPFWITERDPQSEWKRDNASEVPCRLREETARFVPLTAPLSRSRLGRTPRLRRPPSRARARPTPDVEP